jgi:hypothetical protein
MTATSTSATASSGMSTPAAVWPISADVEPGLP